MLLYRHSKSMVQAGPAPCRLLSHGFRPGQRFLTRSPGGPRQTSPAARLRAACRLLRPGHALTAVADALAGLAIAWGLGPENLQPGAWLLPLAAFLFYGGGVALNDFCDARRDHLERPAKPIPTGHISRAAALALSFFCLAAGLALAIAHGPEAGVVATGLAALIGAYNFRTQHHGLLGPFNLGLCRSGSLLLGMAANPAALAVAWPLATLPWAYAATFNRLGRWEEGVHQAKGVAAFGIIVLAVGSYGYLAASQGQWPAFAFLGAFAALLWPDLGRACRQPSAAACRQAVETAVYCLVVFDAAVAAVFAGPLTALGILALLPLARWCARRLPAG